MLENELQKYLDELEIKRILIGGPEKIEGFPKVKSPKKIKIYSAPIVKAKTKEEALKKCDEDNPEIAIYMRRSFFKSLNRVLEIQKKYLCYASFHSFMKLPRGALEGIIYSEENYIN